MVSSRLFWELNLRYRNVQRFRGGLVFKAHRLVYHSTLGLRVMKKKRRVDLSPRRQRVSQREKKTSLAQGRKTTTFCWWKARREHSLCSKGGAACVCSAKSPQGNTQQPQVNYSPCFKNDDLPCRVNSGTLPCRVNDHSRNRVNSSLQVAGG